MKRSCESCENRTPEDTCKCKSSERFNQKVTDDYCCDYWDGNCEHCNWAGHPLYQDICCDCDWEDEDDGGWGEEDDE